PEEGLLSPCYKACATARRHFAATQVSRRLVTTGAFKDADRYPDIVLSGHVHNYQRYTRQIAGRDLPFIVAGGGGYFNIYKIRDTKAQGRPFDLVWSCAR
ncbi:MAG: hypothetical protein ACRD6W_11745, partial [Nitrososphaerales archaeon]